MTTLYQFISSELQLKGLNELENDGKFTFFDSDYSFMQKIARYDEDVKEIVNHNIFRKNRLLDEQADDHFKQAFLNRFLDKSIKTQTIELFSNKVIFTFMMHDEFINHVYDVNSFLTNETISDTVSKGNNQSSNENRNARADLPQNQVNVNVESTELEFANEFAISKNKDTSNNESESKSTNRHYSMDNLVKINGLLESVFVEFDKNCFMQVF